MYSPQTEKQWRRETTGDRLTVGVEEQWGWTLDKQWGQTNSEDGRTVETDKQRQTYYRMYSKK